MAQWQDLSTKATDVQEAAAAAVEAENARMAALVSKGAYDPRSDLSDAEAAKAVEDSLPYPFDPYDLAEIEKVPFYFSWLEHRDPAGLKDKLAGTKRATSELLDASTSFEGTASSFAVFRGNFVKHLSKYLGEMEKAARHQSDLALELHALLLDLQGILGQTSKDVAETADQAIASLNDIAEGGSGAGRDLMLALASLTVGAIGAAATAGSAGAAAPVAFALVHGTLGMADAATSTSSGSVADPTVDGVLNKMFGRIDATREELSDKEAKLITFIDTDDREVTDRRSNLEPIGGHVGDEMRYNGNDLRFDLAEIRYFAKEDMPHMASGLAAGNNAAADATGASGAHVLGDVYEPWVALCTRLQRITGRTSQHIFDAAEDVIAAATAFAQQDGITAAELRKVEDRIKADDNKNGDGNGYTPDDRVEPVMPAKPATSGSTPGNFGRKDP